jgi:Coenzyme PQQ synthesis protein D (PqqD)
MECDLAISFDAHVAVPPHVLLQQVGEESVLLDLKTETYFGLDPVGTRMWEALTTAATVDAAYRELLETYEVEPNRLRLDMEELIENLLRNGLVETTGE